MPGSQPRLLSQSSIVFLQTLDWVKCYLGPIIYISCHRSETYSFVKGIGNTELMRLTEVNHEYNSRCKVEQDTGVIKEKKGAMQGIQANCVYM